MIKILILAALAALTATPASAKASHQLRHAAASLTENNIASGLAIRGGKVVGADPDTHVRFELQRDNPFY